MDDSLTNRIAPVFMGIFLFFFGLPFTLVPFMIFLDGAIDPSYPFAAIFMIAFTIPFLMAGLLVQFMGLSMICLLYTSPSPRDATLSRMPSSA